MTTEDDEDKNSTGSIATMPITQFMRFLQQVQFTFINYQKKIQITNYNMECKMLTSKRSHPHLIGHRADFALKINK